MLMERLTVTNPAVMHVLCAMTKALNQHCIARSGLPHDDDIILLVIVEVLGVVLCFAT